MRQAKLRSFSRTFPPPAGTVEFMEKFALPCAAEAGRQLDTQIVATLLTPPDWIKGQLLNVRIAGAGYRVTILGEEYDFRRPERCLEFSNSFDCQQFVSEWYSRQSHDPRA